MDFIFLFFYIKFEIVEKIGYHSNFDFECNTERGLKESLSIALGLCPLSFYGNYSCDMKTFKQMRKNKEENLCNCPSC